VALILLLCSCGTVTKKGLVNKGVEEFFYKIESINFSDFSEKLFDEEIKKYHKDVKEYESRKPAIIPRIDYLNKIIFEFGIVQEGNTLIDLGSQFGIDCILLRQIIIGNKGRVIGVDIQEPYNVLARKYSEYFGYDNVDFILGDIRYLPIENNIADVIISNYTLPMIVEKEKAFSEIYRILKDGGICYIGDVVIWGKNFELLEKLKNDTLNANYVNKTIRKEEYLETLKRIGFKNIKIIITDYAWINDKGDIFGVKSWFDRFRVRKKIIAASVYIYAEK